MTKELQAHGLPGVDQEQAVLDVFLCGPMFLDMVFGGLPTPPRPGIEVWAEGMASLPGGIANLAVAAGRLGLRTGLAAGFGGDVYGRWCWEILADEGIDLSRSTRVPGHHTSVTVSIAYDDDRAMVTHGHEFPIGNDELIGNPPSSRAVIIDLDDRRQGETWWRRAADAGSLVFADVGWDPTERWDPARLESLESCHGFLPNASEAMAYTRTDSPERAARALAERVPVVVVTMGADGAVAIDAVTGEEARVPAVAATAVDPTGAGDVFLASFVSASLHGWTLERRLRFAALCASLAVQQYGGSLAAPGIGDLHDWWNDLRAAHEAGHAGAAALWRDYGFLGEALPAPPDGVARRAEATFALDADL